MRRAPFFLGVLLACPVVFATLAVAHDDYRTPPIDPQTGRYAFQEVVQEQGTAAELYSRAKAWIAKAYKSPRTVIQLDDATGGRLVVKGNFSIASFAVDGVSHTWTIEVKDGRYRYTLSDFIASVSFGGAHDEVLIGAGHRKGRAMLDEIVTIAEPMIAGLKSAMHTPSPAGSTDW